MKHKIGFARWRHIQKRRDWSLTKKNTKILFLPDKSVFCGLRIRGWDIFQCLVFCLGKFEQWFKYRNCTLQCHLCSSVFGAKLPRSMKQTLQLHLSSSHSINGNGTLFKKEKTENWWWWYLSLPRAPRPDRAIAAWEDLSHSCLKTCQQSFYCFMESCIFPSYARKIGLAASHRWLSNMWPGAK